MHNIFFSVQHAFFGSLNMCEFFSAVVLCIFLEEVFLQDISFFKDFFSKSPTPESKVK